jgi:hypothetical protein
MPWLRFVNSRLVGFFIWRALCGALALAVATRSSYAHPVSISRALVYVRPDEITAEIEVFLEDLYLFHTLRTDSRDYLSATEIGRGIQLHRQFIAERFQILDIDGRPLVSKLDSTTWQPPASGVPLAELMDHQLTFSLRFDLDEAPEFLTFVQKFTDGGAVLPSEMTLHVQQEQQPESEPVALRPHEPYILRLRWDGPPLSMGDGREQQVAWLVKAKQETLGISSYSSTYSFLYVENRQVRHEILIPLQTLLLDLPIEHEHRDFLSPEEQRGAAAVVGDYFAKGLPVRINGATVEAKFEKCDFFGLATKDFARDANDRDVSLANGRVGVILSYRCPAFPETVSMSWNRFTESMWAVDVVILAGDRIEKRTLSRVGNRQQLEWESPLPHRVVPFSPVRANDLPQSLSLSWTAILGFDIAILIWLVGWRILRPRLTKSPSTPAVFAAAVVALVVGWFAHSRIWQSDPISTAEAAQIFAPLHRNVYRAFECPTDGEVYDALALCVDGELLEHVYRQIHQSLDMQDQGGAIAHVTSVEVSDGTVQQTVHARSEPSFYYVCQWDVAGNIEHWGHLHERRQRFVASFRLNVINGYWRITHWDVLDEQPLGTTVTVREFSR